MISSPHIFDQEVVARPCRVGCVAHVHAADLVPPDPGNNELGGGRPSGWTVQGTKPFHATAAERDLMWFVCNDCEALVSELEVEAHRCA